MGKITATVRVTNQIDRILADRGFLPDTEVRSLTLENALIDTGATRLCLPSNAIHQLGLPLIREIDVKIATGVTKSRLFNNVLLSLQGQEDMFNCIELPEGEDPLIGVLVLEALGIELDLPNQRLHVLPQRGKDTYLTVL